MGVFEEKALKQGDLYTKTPYKTQQLHNVIPKK